ncbi:Concanavalin A-like lectin/glucanases superfamily protein [Halomonas shengliensis]|uniref:Concanavalin A-like lectin/glucanases superfamily protein n=1 Tax=Halomonas shengliensis TaxID=419597 RepID=A0A1H0IEY8_9GAMM|nr:LamG-like jellyroll fold domain-containing protein [Halomonas shengliensis]SDO30017.1 Concanavalin A-like lectin/glucanases superfamily protein [Halomonas shengliensis]
MSLIARYKLDGNARDSEGSAHGTAIDVTWAPSQLVDGGGEARLNGTTSRLDTVIQFTTETAVSLPIWFHPRQGAGHLIGQHDGTDGLAIEQTATGKIRLLVGGAASQEVTVYPGEYHHAVPVYNDGEATLYLDNEAVATVTETVTWPAVPVTIGARADGSEALPCDVVDVRGYDEALNETGIDSLNTSPDSNGDAVSDYSPPQSGLRCHYRFDSLQNSVVIDENGIYDGVSYGVSLVESFYNKAAYFDGASYIDAGQALDCSADFTVHAIVEPDSPLPAGDQALVYKGTTNREFYLFVRSGEVGCRVFYNGSSNSYLELTYPVPTGQKFNIGVRRAGLNVSLFVNGVEVAIGVLTSSVLHTSQPMNIGRYGGGALYYSGSIDELVTNNIGLSDAEMQSLSAGGLYVLRFPYFAVRGLPSSFPLSAYNPHPTPIPNPTAIPRSGRSGVNGVTALLTPPAWFDQRDGSGGSHLSPAGVVSRPDRQGRLSGNTTDQNGQPVSRRVRCFERRTGRIVRETWSNAAGYYQFDDLDPAKRFTVVAHDYSGTYNAVIADNAQPEVPA